MSRIEGVKPGMEVIGADGAHVGTVDALDGKRIRLIKADSGLGSHAGHRHYIPGGLVAEVEGNRVRLSANGVVAVMMSRTKPMSRTRRIAARCADTMSSTSPRR